MAPPQILLLSFSLLWCFPLPFPSGVKCDYSPWFPHTGSPLHISRPLKYSIFALIRELYPFPFSDHIFMNVLQAFQTNIIHSEFVVFHTPVSPWKFNLLLPSSIYPHLLIQLSPTSVLPSLSVDSPRTPSPFPSPITAA